MKPVLSREQMQSFDQRAIRDFGVPGLVLMENAGRGACDAVRDALGPAGRQLGPVVVVCGAGNNGGDGFVVARRLLSLGADVTVFMAMSVDKLSDDARVNHDAYRAVGGAVDALDDASMLLPFERAIENASVVVDALFGTGLERPIEGRLARLVQIFNHAPGLKVALDLPSGLHADSGEVLGTCIRADLTVTFAHLKRGLLSTQGHAHAGHVVVADIGLPATLNEIEASAWLSECDDLRGVLKRRAPDVHKGAAGRVAVVAGSPGKTGAALLVAQGALRAGAGLVTLVNYPDVADTLDLRVVEAMTARVDRDDVEVSLHALLENIDAIAIGPGLGLDEAARRLAEGALNLPVPKVIDADGLTLFVNRLDVLRAVSSPLVLTPHPGEAARLLGSHASDIERDRFGAAQKLSELTSAVVLLKGARTIVAAPGRLPVVNGTGTPALATAGAGDVLTGIVTALACRLDPFDAAWAGAALHGLAAERWTRAGGGDRGLLAHEVADLLPRVMASALGYVSDA